MDLLSQFTGSQLCIKLLQHGSQAHREEVRQFIRDLGPMSNAEVSSVVLFIAGTCLKVKDEEFASELFDLVPEELYANADYSLFSISQGWYDNGRYEEALRISEITLRNTPGDGRPDCGMHVGSLAVWVASATQLGLSSEAILNRLDDLCAKVPPHWHNSQIIDVAPKLLRMTGAGQYMRPILTSCWAKLAIENEFYGGQHQQEQENIAVLIKTLGKDPSRPPMSQPHFES